MAAAADILYLHPHLTPPHPQRLRDLQHHHHQRVCGAARAPPAPMPFRVHLVAAQRRAPDPLFQLAAHSICTRSTFYVRHQAAS